ncbi:hypothetical protein I6A60_31665 [Frankia sp. AgB1.9]|uniref:hypothetical protein n=1 Tax=unclassified Frankia TaxID=2632575 RepID=UPI0019348EF5|nr:MULTISPECIES: hypothetical protein [unclassified Frankia]MBL7552386.1 hypothetical protein [Frankia sp. AgB1.9]MBL7619641.1 hypothetical protein [Frankia sp. AgB1.8]
MSLCGRRVPSSTAIDGPEDLVDAGLTAGQQDAGFTVTRLTGTDLAHAASAFGEFDDFGTGDPAGHSPGTGPVAGRALGAAGSPAKPPGPEPVVEQFEQVLGEYSVDSASLRARVLTATTAAQRDLAAGKRAVDTARRRPRTRPHSTRPAGGPVSARSTGTHRAGSARPRLVTAGALAAVVSVIGVSAGIASVVQSQSKPSRVLVTPAPRALVTQPAAPLPAPATQAPDAPSATPSAGQNQPTADPTAANGSQSLASTSQQRGTGSGRGGQVPTDNRPRAARGLGVVPFRSGSELVLPDRNTTDWVVFGDGHSGVVARAAIPFQLLDVSRIAGVGSAQRGYPTSVSWTWGTPRPQGSHSTSRLRIPGGRSATITTYRGPHDGKLAFYVGGAGSLRVTVSAAGLQSSSFTVALPSSTAVVTLDLGGLPYWTPATISISGGGGSSFSLAAAVLD